MHLERLVNTKKGIAVFFEICIYETLDQDGRRDSIIIQSGDKSRSLVVDELAHAGPNLRSNVDIGPLRFYTDAHGLSVQPIVSRLSSPDFRRIGNQIDFRVSHQHLPLDARDRGYHILLLPPGYSGNVSSTIKPFEVIFMADVHQLMITGTISSDSPSIEVRGCLDRGAPAPTRATHKNKEDIFRANPLDMHSTVLV